MMHFGTISVLLSTDLARFSPHNRVKSGEAQEINGLSRYSTYCTHTDPLEWKHNDP